MRDLVMCWLERLEDCWLVARPRELQLVGAFILTRKQDIASSGNLDG
jgi:hypothetical protein